MIYPKSSSIYLRGRLYLLTLGEPGFSGRVSGYQVFLVHDFKALGLLLVSMCHCLEFRVEGL